MEWADRKPIQSATALTDVDMCVAPRMRYYWRLLSFQAIVRSLRNVMRSPANSLVQAFLTRRVAIPVERFVRSGDHDALGVEVIVEAFDTAFTADAAVAYATPW